MNLKLKKFVKKHIREWFRIFIYNIPVFLRGFGMVDRGLSAVLVVRFEIMHRGFKCAKIRPKSILGKIWDRIRDNFFRLRYSRAHQKNFGVNKM